MDCIRVKDRDNILEIAYEDMVKYHGRFHIGGVAMAYQALKLGLSQLLPDGEVPRREKISFVSGLGETATGVLDAVEMATRARTRGQLTTNTELGRDVDAAVAPNGSKFYFELSYDGRRIGLALKKGLVPEEFIVLSQQAMSRQLDAVGAARLQEVKEAMAADLMSRPAEELFNCITF